MATVRGGYTVAPHVQAFADAVVVHCGLAEDNAGTYYGHDPTPQRALDIFVPVDTATLGNCICDFAVGNLEHYGIRYLIYRRRIFNLEVGNYWRSMVDRGGATQNHYDHVHISFYADAPAEPGELTDDEQEEDDMALTPEQAAHLYETTKATNAAVGRMETAIRDSTSGMQVQMDRLIAAVAKLAK